MIEFVRSWVIEIVGVIIFTTLFQIIIPSSSMKKYINMIIGLLIILVIMNPFIKILNDNIDIEKTMFANITEKNYKIKNTTNEDLVKLQQEQTINLYKEKIITEIKNLIETNTDYIVCDIDLEIEDDVNNKDFGKLKFIQIDINEAYKDDENSIKVEKINSIHITSNNREDFNNSIPVESTKIKNLLYQKYGLYEGNIQIYIIKK